MTQVVADGTVGRSPTELSQEMRHPLTAIWNAVHILSLTRDEATVEWVREVVVRQMIVLSDIADELEAVTREDALLERSSESSVAARL